MKKYDEESIEQLLSEMPKVKDEKSFESYYENISKQINSRSKTNKPSWLFPLLSSAAALFLLVVIGMQLFNANDTADRATDMESSEMERNFSAESDEDSSEESESEGSQPKEGQDDAGIASNDETNIVEIQEASPSLVLTKDEIEDRELVTFIVPDHQSMYYIPISLDVSNQDKYEFFNEYGSHIQEETWGVSTSVLDQMEFIGLNHENIPLIEIGGDIQGSAMELATIEVLRYFENLGNDKVIIQDPNGNPVQFPNMGELEQVKLDHKPKVYKLYEANEGVLFWAEKRMADVSIEEAVEELKLNEVDFNLTAPVPDYVDFTLEDNDSTLNVSMTESKPVRSFEEMVYMIEGILLTAKSYGYEEVNFKNFGVNEIDKYDLTQPIEVPKYINPK